MKLHNSSKKGQGLSLNVIIIAALALIVLVVMVFIFSGKIKNFGEGSENCVSLGGQCTSDSRFSECMTAGNCKCNDGEIYLKGTNCEKTSNICCKPVY